MVRNTTWLMMLVLVAGVQVFAAVCAVRCAVMSMPVQAAGRSMPAMEHCSGTMIRSSKSNSGQETIQAPQSCIHAICKEDLSVTKDRTAIDQTDAVHILADASLGVPVFALPAPMNRNWRPPAGQSTTLPSGSLPLISNLRI